MARGQTRLRVNIDPRTRDEDTQGQECRVVLVAVGDHVYRLSAQRGALEIMTTAGEAISVDPMAGNVVHVRPREE